MGDPQRQRGGQLGATFIPGGADDFYMPTEVVSPAPQRVTPEMPGRIQENLHRLELDATPSNRLSGLQSPGPPQALNQYAGPNSSMKSAASTNDHNASYNSLPPPRDSAQDTPTSVYSATPTASHKTPLYEIDTVDQPRFSPFPPLQKRPANVPPSDEEKEGILDRARVPVLNTNDPEVQLTWAQDALQFVEIAAQNETRLSDQAGGRPQTPQIEHRLKVDAVNIVSFLADQHHPKAEFLKGMWLEFGKFGVRMDKKEAFRCYQRSAQRGFARAEYRMGMQFETSNEPDKAIKHYKLGVQQGDSASNYRLGMMMLLGQHGQPLDYDRGIKLISYSAETADENAPQGAYVFGMLQSRELPQVNLPERCLALNVAGARYNLEKAAYLGFAKAQAKMGAAYELCQLGCAFDPALSLHYNALAARQGEAEAEMAISKWFLCGYEGVFEKNEEVAFSYAQRAAQGGLPTAEFAVGYFYEVGIHVQPDLTKSRVWYQKAADHGNKDALARVEGIARAKTLSRKDHENVAVAKIKSQYGSHRGRRPDRYKEALAPMPTITDEYNPINMPEPRLSTPQPGEYRPSPYSATNRPDIRPPSVAPYPIDDLGDPIPASPPVKAQTTNQIPRKAPGQRPPSPIRSESSFGDNNYRGSAFPTFRPSPHAAPSKGPPAGRSGPPTPHGTPSTQPIHLRRPGPATANSHGPPSPAGQVRLPASQTPLPQPASTLKIDIGFSAPPDLSGADKPKRLPKPPENPNMRPPTLPPLRTSSHENTGSRPQERLSSLPHSSAMPAHVRPTSPQRRPMSAGRMSPAGPAPSSIRPTKIDGASLESPLPSKLANTSRPVPTPPPSVPVAKPPGKGPKTFTEMGLPPAKQENDCIIM